MRGLLTSQQLQSYDRTQEQPHNELRRGEVSGGGAVRRSLLCVCAAGLFVLFGAVARAEEPITVTVCQLKADPGSFNHKLVEVEGFVSHGFEDFSLFDPTCPPTAQDIWLEYGGTQKSDTTYCCGPTAGKTRPKELRVEGIPVPLVDNDLFKQFDREIQPPIRSGNFGSIVHATLVGRFFAGTKIQEEHESGKGPTFWGGFGHMGCCSLLAIQEVKSVVPQDRDDLDYGASADQPDIDKVGCGYQYLTPVWPWQGDAGVGLQKKTDQSPNSLAFEDPARVASDYLVAQLKLDPSQPPQLTVKRKAQGRVVYEWNPTGNAHSYMVVVSKPFLLTFYAHDPQRIAWVVIAAYDSSCDEPKSVTRIR